MSSSLVIRLPATEDSPLEWVTVDHSGAGVGTPASGPAGDALPLAENRKIVALAPASKVLRLNAKIPIKGNARIRQALPYALEDNLAADIDKQQFAFGKKDDDGLLPVAVVSKQQLEHWLALLREHGLTPTAIFSESDALDLLPATISVLVDRDQVIFRNPAGELTVADEPSMEILLDMFLDQHAAELENDAALAPVSLTIYCDQPAYERHKALWERLHMRSESVDIKILADGALPYLAHQITQHADVNLLQGEFAPKSDLPFKWQNWRIAAILLVAFLALNLVYKGAEYWQLSNADAALDAAAAQVLGNTFPGIGEVSDPWNELRNRLGSSASGGSESTDDADFAEVLEALSSAFAQIPGLRMETVSFRSGSLDLQLIAPDVAALDRLRQLISDPGRFTAEIQSANPADDVIKGRINIKLAGES